MKVQEKDQMKKKTAKTRARAGKLAKDLSVRKARSVKGGSSTGTRHVKEHWT